MGRREKWALVGAILAALEVEWHRGANGRLTNVAAKANVAYDRLQGYIIEMAANGLVTPSKIPQLTPKGREFLRHYRQWIELLDRFGFAGGEWAPPAHLGTTPEGHGDETENGT